MKGRAVAVRIILGVAALTTVATSAPADFELTSLGERTLEGGTVRVSAIANRTAADHADRFLVKLELSTRGAPVTVTLVPDDKALASEQVVIDGIARQREYDLIDVCVRGRACDAGVSIAMPANAEVTVKVVVTLVAFGDPSLFFPDDRSFPRGSDLELHFEP